MEARAGRRAGGDVGVGLAVGDVEGVLQDLHAVAHQQEGAGGTRARGAPGLQGHEIVAEEAQAGAALGAVEQAGQAAATHLRALDRALRSQHPAHEEAALLQAAGLEAQQGVPGADHRLRGREGGGAVGGVGGGRAVEHAADGAHPVVGGDLGRLVDDQGHLHRVAEGGHGERAVGADGARAAGGILAVDDGGRVDDHHRQPLIGGQRAAGGEVQGHAGDAEAARDGFRAGGRGHAGLELGGAARGLAHVGGVHVGGVHVGGVHVDAQIGLAAGAALAADPALAAGATLAGVLELAAELRAGWDGPIVLFSYANPLLRLGPAIGERLAAAGIDAVLVVDLPPEHAPELRAPVEAAGVGWVSLVAPTTPASRLPAVARSASAFVYAVALRGVTGATLEIDEELVARLDAIRAHTARPVAVGFGVREPAQAAALAPYVDGVVVGSAFIEAAEQGPAALAAKVSAIRAALTREGEAAR
ncbi:MAG: tryptophan synthase subunit alpha [Myxococcales bacterium]|nr:tryptophan synthase subunit alpha [Myxococcales bacterium]